MVKAASIFTAIDFVNSNKVFISHESKKKRVTLIETKLRTCVNIEGVRKSVFDNSLDIILNHKYHLKCIQIMFLNKKMPRSNALSLDISDNKNY